MGGRPMTRRPLIALGVLVAILAVGYAVDAVRHDGGSPGPQPSPGPTTSTVSTSTVSTSTVSTTTPAGPP